MQSPFPCSPLIDEWSWKNSHIEKKTQPNKEFFVSNLIIFIFHKNLPLDKLEAGDIKYGDILVKFQSKKYQNNVFLVSNLGIFVLAWHSLLWQIRECWFKIWQNVFIFLAPKYLNKSFLVPKLEILIFFSFLNFPIRQIWVFWFEIWQYCFQFPAKIPK